jgi:hypothetical protein
VALSDVIRDWLLRPVLERLTTMEMNMATSPQVVALKQAVDGMAANVTEQGPLAQALIAAFQGVKDEVAALRTDLAEANVEVPAATARLQGLDAQMDAVTAAIRSALPATPPPPAPGA